MQTTRHFSFSDQVCLNVDQALRAIFNNPKTTGRSYPATQPPANLSSTASKEVAGLMRINHSGEVCAQALYHGQGLASRNKQIKNEMQQAAIEEGDHLAWCQRRLNELQSHTSYLNALWYSGSLMIGLTAGLMGDRWSLGFLAETENQVVRHLEKHLALLPKEDQRTQQILQQMRNDEAKHRDAAIHAGAALLPKWVKTLMNLTSQVMVKAAYWI